MTVTIDRKRIPVADYAEASRAFREYRDASGYGASGMHRHDGLIHDEAGKLVAHVSYNGRVWAGSPRGWKPGTAPIA